MQETIGDARQESAQAARIGAQICAEVADTHLDLRAALKRLDQTLDGARAYPAHGTRG
jgi:hypothetical protein